VIRLPIPPLTQERRIALGKQVKARAEEARVAMRNIRRDANDAAKKAQKNSELTEDELKSLLDEIQKMTDTYIATVDKLASEKEKELLSF
jgi:ribosome recycling factor